MLDFLIDSFNVKTMAMVSAAIAAIATVLTLTMPMLLADSLGKRMKAVAVEREKLRARERERMAQAHQNVHLRPSAKQSIQSIVDRFNLKKWVGQEGARLKLVQSGYRGQAPYITYLFFRMVTPAASALFTAVYIFVVLDFQQPAMVKLGICIAAAYIGMHAPLMFLKNRIARRQLSIKRAFPDTLDLLLICVESGMSIEAAFRKVSEEVGTQSVALAEELTLTTAELSFLPDRRQAYENLGIRTGVESVKQIVTALIQAERYGTPLGAALRVVGKESRDNRMMLAEKKAASLPPKLTVPMILFFLPVLFVIIMTPAIIQISRTMH